MKREREFSVCRSSRRCVRYDLESFGCRFHDWSAWTGSENLADFDASIQYVKVHRGVSSEIDSVSSDGSAREIDEVFHRTFGSRWMLSPAFRSQKITKRGLITAAKLYTDPNFLTDLHYRSRGVNIGTQSESGHALRITGWSTALITMNIRFMHPDLSWWSDFILDAERIRQSVFLSDDYTIHAGSGMASSSYSLCIRPL